MSNYTEGLTKRIKRKTDEVENNLLTIKNIEGRINRDESAIIEFRIENDILMEMDPDRFPDRETAQAYLDERVAKTTEEETTPNGSLLEALTKPVG